MAKKYGQKHPGPTPKGKKPGTLKQVAAAESKPETKQLPKEDAGKHFPSESIVAEPAPSKLCVADRIREILKDIDSQISLCNEKIEELERFETMKEDLQGERAALENAITTLGRPKSEPRFPTDEHSEDRGSELGGSDDQQK